MIQRAQSFSKGGKVIQRVMSIQKYKIDQQKLQRMLLHKKGGLSDITHHNKRQPIHIEGFDKVPGRNRPNSFQIFNIKDNNTKIDYKFTKDCILTKSPEYIINKEQDERLSQLFKRDIYTSQEGYKESCRRFVESKNQHIRTPQDLQTHRKSCHSLNFQKQTSRPFDEKIKKMTLETQRQLILTRSNSLRDVSQRQVHQKNTFIRPQKVHSFASYTKRDFLSQKKIKCAPEVSGIDSFKINPQKFKGNWKTINPPKFDKVANKHLNRYDRDCPQWHPQLNYNIKDTYKVANKNLNFQSQTTRKDNLVKSSYPMRIAI